MDSIGCQADAVIAKRFYDRKTDIIFSNDGDFLAMLGGQVCCVKDFDYTNKGNGDSKHISNIVLSSGSSAVARRWADALEWSVEKAREHIVILSSNSKMT